MFNLNYFIMSNFDFLGSFLGKKAQLKKDGHDVSSLEAMSMPFGVQVPISYYPVVPNEHYKGKLSGVLQTAPMREDNFASIYSNQKAVFVPISSIWKNYLSLTQNDRSTRKDSLYDFPQLFPVFNLADVLYMIFPNYVFSKTCEAFVSLVPDYEDFYWSNDKYVDKQGNVLYTILNALDDSYETRLARMFYDFVYEDSSHNKIINYVNKVINSCSPSGCPFYMDVLRMLDSLGYGNYLPALETSLTTLVSRQYDQSYNIQVTEYFYFTNGVNFKVTSSYFDYFYIECSEDFGLCCSILVDALPLIAYQYYLSLVERTNYRNADTLVVTWDAILNVFDKDINNATYLVQHGHRAYFTFGLDWFNEGQFEQQDCEMFGDHCTSFLNNLGRHCLDSAYSGNDDITSLDEFLMFVYLFSLSNPKLPSDLYTTMQTSVVSGSIPYTDVNDLQNNIVSAYANSSALYSLRQSLLRAGVRRDKQMQAIFGVSGANNLTEPIRILDDTSSKVDIHGLLNQAETDVAALGARAARGDGKFGLSFKFDSEEFGFIFIVQSFTCAVFYENFMIDRVHRLEPESWFNPKFNHLGLEPVRREYISLLGEAFDDLNGGAFSYASHNVAQGFTARNYELKQRINKVHGAFTNFGFSQPSPSHDDKLYSPGRLSRGNSTFGGFVPTIINQQTNWFDYRDDLYFSPDMMNNIFVNMVSGGIYGDYSFDQFRCAFSLNVHKVSPMPKLGLFKLDV